MSLNLYPAFFYGDDCNADAVDDDIDAICEKIHNACKGWGTDEDGVIDALGSTTPAQRCLIPGVFKEKYGKSLKSVMDSECGDGVLGTALQFLGVTPVQAECDMIDMACKGLGTNELVLYPIICGRSNADMRALKQCYFDLNTKDLSSMLDSELGGTFEKLIVNCLQAGEDEYDEEVYNEDKIAEDVAAIYELAQGRMGTDEVGLFKLICSSPTEHLHKVNAAYEAAHEFSLQRVLNRELGGMLGDAAVFMVKMKLKPDDAVADLFIEACKGFGTNELLLTCTLIRYQEILPSVMAKYIDKTGVTLVDTIKSETKRDFEKLLVALCEGAM